MALAESVSSARLCLWGFHVSLHPDVTNRATLIKHGILDNYCKLTLLPRGIISKTDVNHARIEDGNIAAYRGNAVSDAALYFNGYRTDEVTMRYMYGLESSEIRMLDKKPAVIETLNTYGSWQANSHNQDVPTDVKNVFQALIGELKQDSDQDLDDHSAPLTSARDRFLLAHDNNIHLFCMKKKD